LIQAKVEAKVEVKVKTESELRNLANSEFGFEDNSWMSN
jgi:hypothetical protein